MPSAVQRLLNLGLITPPKFLQPNLMLEVIMGSRAYGCNDPDSSDYDIYGICIPPKEYVFPHTRGLVYGFDTIPRFDQWHEPHVKDNDGRREYDFTVFGIIRFFQLAAENNPNIVDMLFVHETMVKHCTQVGRMILDARKIFLSKLCWKKFRGYASDQFHKMKERSPEGKRKVLVEKYGYDVKFGAHCMRLLREAEQILTEGDLNLYDGNGELKAIRNGEWSFDKLEKEFNTRKIAVEEAFGRCTLPERPDHEKLKELLLSCLESHYGSLGKVIARPDAATNALFEIEAILEKVRPTLTVGG
jgi:predicted nucleotidyltransferase